MQQCPGIGEPTAPVLACRAGLRNYPRHGGFATSGDPEGLPTAVARKPAKTRDRDSQRRHGSLRAAPPRPDTIYASSPTALRASARSVCSRSRPPLCSRAYPPSGRTGSLPDYYQRPRPPAQRRPTVASQKVAATAGHPPPARAKQPRRESQRSRGHATLSRHYAIAPPSRYQANRSRGSAVASRVADLGLTPDDGT